MEGWKSVDRGIKRSAGMMSCSFESKELGGGKSIRRTHVCELCVSSVVRVCGNVVVAPLQLQLSYGPRFFSSLRISSPLFFSGVAISIPS